MSLSIYAYKYTHIHPAHIYANIYTCKPNPSSAQKRQPTNWYSHSTGPGAEFGNIPYSGPTLTPARLLKKENEARAGPTQVFSVPICKVSLVVCQSLYVNLMGTCPCMSYYALYLSKISLSNVTYFSLGVICLFMEIYDYCLLVRHVMQCFTCHSVKSRVIGNESSCFILNSL